MNKTIRIAIMLCVALFLFFSYFSQKTKNEGALYLLHNNQDVEKPHIALIFDDLGESLSDIRDIYALGVPVTVAIIPELKFSKNIAYIAYRCDFSVLIHLPLEPKKGKAYATDKYTFISSDLPKRKNLALLRQYLNYVRIAVGVNTHMGSKATEDPELMRLILPVIKQRHLIFIDSKTSLKTVAYAMAKNMGLTCAINEGFIDAVDDPEAMKAKLYALVDVAKEKGKIVVIAHPKEKTIKLLEEEVSNLKNLVQFVTIKDYFEL